MADSDGWSIEQVADFVAEIGYPQYQVRNHCKQTPRQRALLSLSLPRLFFSQLLQ